ncbi:MAG TPA: type II CAAX endopeptidase family protein, partial [Opitutales bacterium]|nr:type II CAAX endopeptidase family protein [Opitutales bacterium]
EIWHESAPNGLNTYLVHKGFDDYFDRLRWVAFILGLPWLIHHWGLWSLTRLGFPRGSKTKRTLCRGILIGVVAVVLVAGAQSFFHVISWNIGNDETKIALIVLKSLLGGLAIGFLEELVFRGLVFRVFYTAMPVWLAMLGTSLFFAYTHFKMPDSIWLLTDQQVHVDSGFFVAYWTLLGITENFQLWPFVNLTLLGLLLNLI